MTPGVKYDFKFKDYAPWVFRNLREKFHVDAADYMMSLTNKYILSEIGSPGKSGSFFYYSRDYRFIIKTIHHGEHKFMRKILKEYYEVSKFKNHAVLSFHQNSCHKIFCSTLQTTPIRCCVGFMAFIALNCLEVAKFILSLWEMCCHPTRIFTKHLI